MTPAQCAGKYINNYYYNNNLIYKSPVCRGTSVAVMPAVWLFASCRYATADVSCSPECSSHLQWQKSADKH